jgi:hypothetical protein
VGGLRQNGITGFLSVEEAGEEVEGVDVAVPRDCACAGAFSDVRGAVNCGYPALQVE